MTNVVNKYTHKPTPDDVYIGRGSRWGNPFKIGPDGDREAVVAKYAHWITDKGSHLLPFIPELRGKNLICFCAPQLCHGHVLAILCDEIIEGG
jgi:hypothetical protein